MGIEPTYPAWKAGVLPLNYTRVHRAYYEHRNASNIICESEENVNLFFQKFQIYFRNACPIDRQHPIAGLIARLSGS